MKTNLRAKLATETVQAPSLRTLQRAYVQFVKTTFSKSPDVLADFGIQPNKDEDAAHGRAEGGCGREEQGNSLCAGHQGIEPEAGDHRRRDERRRDSRDCRETRGGGGEWKRYERSGHERDHRPDAAQQLATAL